MYSTLKRCSELAKQNISTSRFYKNKYLQYFKTSGEGKKTKFEESSTVELLRLIGESYTKGLDSDQITGLLDMQYGVTVTDIAQQDNNSIGTTQHEDLVQSIRSVFVEEISKRDSLILDLQEELEGIKQALAEQAERAEDSARRLEERDRDITQRLSDITTAQEQRNKEKVPWYRRLFNLDK